MTEAVTPPNPADSSDSQRSVPDPTLLTIDALRREIAMLSKELEGKIDATEKLNKERFRRIDALMERSEEMRQEQKADTRSAVEAALDNQKEATHKMEKSVSEQISSLRTNLETTHDGLRDNIADLKDRLTIQESIKVGVVEQKSESRHVSNTALAIIGVVFTGILVALAVVAGFAVGT